MKESKHLLDQPATGETNNLKARLLSLEETLGKQANDHHALQETVEIFRDVKATGDIYLVERTAVLFIPFSFANFYKTAAVAQANLTSAITLLCNSSEAGAPESLTQVIAKLSRGAKLSRWERVEWVLDVMVLLSIKGMEPLVQSLVANIQLRRIYSDTKGGRTIGAVAERIQSLLGQILCRIDDPKQLAIVRPLIKVLPRVRLGVRNDLKQAWETVETLDDNYLHNKFSHELRERIHGRFSNQDLDVVEGYLDYLETGTLNIFSKALPFFSLEQSDEELRLGITKGDPWSRSVHQLLLELREQLSKVVDHDPSDFAESYRALDCRKAATEKKIKSFSKLLRLNDNLGAIKRSGEIRNRLRDEFFASRDPAVRSQLMMLDEDIERIVYLALDSLYKDWKKKPRKSTSDLLDVLGILVAQLEAYGLTSLSSREVFERAGQGRGLLYTSQARDLARMCIGEYKRIAFQFMSRYRDIAMIVSDNDAKQVDQFVGGLLRRSEMDLHSSVQLAEVLLRGMTALLKHEGDKHLFPKLWPKELITEPLYFGSESDTKDAITLADARATYGSKGVNLAHMAIMGLPVPIGFIIPTTLGVVAQKKGKAKFTRWLKDGLRVWIGEMEQRIARTEGRSLKFGDANNPLLLSIRSNSAVSMPGIMTTIPNIGINDEIADALSQETGDAWFAHETYRLFLRDYAIGVWHMEENVFEPIIDRHKKRKGVCFKDQLPPETMRDVVEDYKQVIRRAGFGRQLDKILGNPFEACFTAVLAVFHSWDSAGAKRYRQHDEISHHWGTGVIVERMRFGNRINRSSDPEQDSLTAVVITRNLHTTQFSMSGDYKKNAQGHDLVASYVTQDSICPIEGMRATHPKLFHELESVADKVDAYFNAPQDMELTVEQGSLWVLQTRTEAYIRQDFPGLDRGDSKPLADGVGVSGGAYRGIVGFLSSDFDLLRKRVKETNSKAGRQVVDGIILLIHSPSTADVPFMLDNAGGWVTQLGGRTSHAALIANQHDISAVFGMTSLVVDEKNHRATIDARRAKKKGVEIKEGDICSIEGHATGGQLFRGSLPLTSKKEGDLLPV